MTFPRFLSLVLQRPAPGNGLLTLAAALVEMGVGLTFFALPGHFQNTSYPLLGSFMNVLAPGFMACGALLLFLESNPSLDPRVTGILYRLAAIPLALLAANFALARVWTGLVTYAVLALGMLLGSGLPRSPCPSPREEGDPAASSDTLFALAAAAEIAIGAACLAAPGSFSRAAYPLLGPYLPLFGAVALAAGAALARTEAGDVRHRVKVWGRAAGIVPLALLAANFALARVWTGVILYGILSLALAGGHHVLAARHKAGASPIPSRSHETILPFSERVLEIGTWVFVILLVSLTIFAPYVSLGRVADVAAAVFFLSVFNLGWYHIVPPLLPRMQRMLLHLGLVTLVFGYLNLVTGGLHSAFTSLLLVPVPMAAPLGPLAPWYIAALAALPLMVDTLIDVSVAARSAGDVLWLLGLHFVPLLTIGAASSVLAAQMRAYLHRLRFRLDWSEVERQIVNAIRASLDIHSILQTAVEGLGRAVAASRCFIQLCYEGRLGAVTSEYLAPGAPSSPGMGASSTVAAAAARAGRTMTAAHATEGVKAELATPIVINNTLEGVICVQETRHPRQWSEEEVALVETVSGQVAVAISHARMYQELLRRNEQLQDISVRDRLTGVYNHGYFQERLEEEIRRSRRTSRPVSLAMLDLDRFKEINDTHGHLTGDAVLQQVAETIQRNLRASDVLARYGGEEFAVIFPETDLETAMHIVNRIRGLVHETRILAATARKPLTVTFSAGVADFPGCATNKEGLLAAADRALYEAKTCGRNRVIAARLPAAT